MRTTVTSKFILAMCVCLTACVAPSQAPSETTTTPKNKRIKAAPRPRNILDKSFQAQMRADIAKESELLGVLELPPIDPRDRHDDNERGKRMILLALRAAYLNAGWARAYGLLGTSLRESDSLDYLGYKSLFLPLGVRLCMGSKLYCNAESDWSAITELRRGEVDNDAKWVIKAQHGKSLILRRESVLSALATNLQGRYIY